MAQQNKATFEGTFNDPTTGLYKTNTTSAIGSDDQRTAIENISDSVPFTLDDSYTWAFPKADTTGTNTYAATFSPAIATLVNGMKVHVKIKTASTGASTLQANATAAKKIFINPTTQAGSGDLVDEQEYIMSYDAALDAAAGGWLIIGGSTSPSGSFVPTTLPADTTIDGQGNELILQGGAAEEVRFVLDGPNNTQHSLHFRTGGLDRWQIHTDNNETGSANVGSDFHIERFDDAGVYIDTPLNIDRTDGVADFNKPPQLTTAPAAGANNNQVPPTAWVQTEIAAKASITFVNEKVIYESIQITDDVTNIGASTTVPKKVFFMPVNRVIDSLMFSLTTPQASGSIFTIDIHVDGTTVLSTKATIDNTENTNLTAVTPYVITDNSWNQGQKVEVFVDQIGNGSAVELIMYIGWH